MDTERKRNTKPPSPNLKRMRGMYVGKRADMPAVTGPHRLPDPPPGVTITRVPSPNKLVDHSDECPIRARAVDGILAGRR